MYIKSEVPSSTPHTHASYEMVRSISRSVHTIKAFCRTQVILKHTQAHTYTRTLHIYIYPWCESACPTCTRANAHTRDHNIHPYRAKRAGRPYTRSDKCDTHTGGGFSYEATCVRRMYVAVLELGVDRASHQAGGTRTTRLLAYSKQRAREEYL